MIISMNIKKVDDCLRKVELDDGTILYENADSECSFDKDRVYEIPMFIYELGQKIILIICDQYGGGCGFNVDIFVNNEAILKPDYEKLWICKKCDDSLYNGDFEINCYSNNRPLNFDNYTFSFQIDFLSQLNVQISEYYYFLNNSNHFFISADDFYNAINLIDLYSENNLYGKNEERKIRLLNYDKVYYKLFFDKYSNHKGNFFGCNESNNNLELNEETYSRIYNNNSFRYQLSNEEKNNNGVHIRLKIGIFNNQKKQVSNLEYFNFYICLKGHQFCDFETSMKCLNEGYYQEQDRYYSCYETCKTCDTFHKPIIADYFKNYCDECKEDYSYFINITEDENTNNIIYKNCYRECPPHAPELP